MRKYLLISLAVVIGLVGIIAIQKTLESGKPDSIAPEPPIVNQEEVPEDPLKVQLRRATEKKTPADQRVTALRKLPSTLGHDHAKQIFGIVTSRDESPTIRNEAMEVVLRQTGTPPEKFDIAESLLKMWSESKEDPTWLDYVLQFTCRIHQQDPKCRRMVERLLLEVASGKHADRKQYAATALITLQRLSPKSPELQSKIDQLTSQSLESPQADDDMTIAAMHASANKSDVQTLKKARELAVDTGKKVRVRMSAIALIGSQGEKSDVKLLEKLSGDQGDSRVRQAAKMQAAKLEKRLEKNQT